MKEIHFFIDETDCWKWIKAHDYLNKKEGVNLMECLHSYKDNELKLLEVKRLHKEEYQYSKVLVSTQMCFLSTDWFLYGYRIFVHDETGKYEITLGGKNERTDREIRMAHNLFKMWRNGCFAL